MSGSVLTLPPPKKPRRFSEKNRSIIYSKSMMPQNSVVSYLDFGLNSKVNTSTNIVESPDVLELIESALIGDQSAFEGLIKRYQKLMSYVVSRFLLDPEQSEEVIQLVLINLYESLGNYKPVGTFSSWVSALTRNQCLMYLRKKKIIHSHLSNYQKQVEQCDEFLKPEEDDVYLNALSQCMNQVNEKSTKILKLKYEKGLSFEEISSLIGKTADTTRRVASRLRAKLKECIELKVGER